MRDRYLEITFRNGRPLAAYLYFPRTAGARSVRTEKIGKGMLVDYGSEGHPIGLEITAPTEVTSDQINEVLRELDVPLLDPEELAPLQAA